MLLVRAANQMDQDARLQLRVALWPDRSEEKHGQEIDRFSDLVTAATGPTHAGLRVRCLAFALDYVLIAIYVVLLVVAGALVSQARPSLARTLFGNPISGQAIGLIVLTLPVTLYFAILEASSWRASWGKRRMRLVVTDGDGGHISFTRSLTRTVLKFIPWEVAHLCVWQISFTPDDSSPIFAAGFALVWLLVAIYITSMLMSPTRQTVYDRLTGTFVLTSS